MNVIAPDYQTERRMAAKLSAFTLPYMLGKRVLDVGTDFGYWAFLSAEKGADYVLGLDRNRDVRGMGHVNLVEMNRRRAEDEGRAEQVAFEEINLGKEWREFGKFDVVFVLSMYHHWYECCGDHNAIWFWLSRHCSADGLILWEGPVDDTDPVVRAIVSDENRRRYTRDAILAAAARYFEPELIGPAKHEPTREVWRFRPLAKRERLTKARMMDGTGGASIAFKYANGRRMKEIESVLGDRPVPGSLNLQLDGPFDWDEGYYRAQVLDVVKRGEGLDVEWKPRWARFYPLLIDGVSACAFRFEGEKYGVRFLELIASVKLRDKIKDQRVTIAR